MEETTRDCASSLPRDVLLEIFVRLPQLDIHLTLGDKEEERVQDLDLLFRRLAMARTAVDGGPQRWRLRVLPRPPRPAPPRLPC